MLGANISPGMYFADFIADNSCRSENQQTHTPKRRGLTPCFEFLAIIRKC
jgi:hypothetical protein